MLFQKEGQGGTHAVVDALDVDGEDPVPVPLFHGLHQAVVANAGVADEDIHIREPSKGGLHGLGVCHIAADGLGPRGLAHGLSGGLVFFVQKIHPVPPGGEELYGGSADAPGAAGDDNGLHLIFFCSWSGGRNTAGWRRSCCRTQT